MTARKVVAGCIVIVAAIAAGIVGAYLASDVDDPIPTQFSVVGNPSPDVETIPIRMQGGTCGPPESTERLQKADIEETDETVTITAYLGPNDPRSTEVCAGVGLDAYGEVGLDQPIGDRTILDGSHSTPRPAAVIPLDYMLVRDASRAGLGSVVVGDARLDQMRHRAHFLNRREMRQYRRAMVRERAHNRQQRERAQARRERQQRQKSA